jgi:7-cyano-7-deazaguanine synthase
MKTVLIFSGGMDSTTLLYHLLDGSHEVQPLIFNYGSKHNERENFAAQAILLLAKNKVGLHQGIPFGLNHLSILFKSSLLQGNESIPHGHYEEENMKKTVVPNRNMIMLSIAIGLAESMEFDAVAFGNHAGDHVIYPDCRAEFVSTLSRASELGTFRHISILSPFVFMDKSQIVSLGNSLLVPFQLTYSCYEGDMVHCGACATCGERREAFYKAGVKDPTEYKISWEETKIICKVG